MNYMMPEQIAGMAGDRRPPADNREEMLKQIMEYDFVAMDLNLYLDTHPTDADALRRHLDAVEKSNSLKVHYQQMYGPLTASAVKNTSRWTWNDNPWPWMAAR